MEPIVLHDQSPWQEVIFGGVYSLKLPLTQVYMKVDI